MAFKKEMLIEYLQDNLDVTLKELISELKLKDDDINRLDVYLSELIEEGVIMKTMTDTGFYEYDYDDRNEEESD